MYKCSLCKRQFRAGRAVSAWTLWEEYLTGKQTVPALARRYGTSESTVKRRLATIAEEWEQPEISGGGFVHLDATYWGRNRGILAGVEDATGQVLYLAFIAHEKVSDYRDAVTSIEGRGYAIGGLIIDGMPSLFREFSRYPIQMCQFHMIQITRRYLKKNPRLKVMRELKDVVATLTYSTEGEFLSRYNAWKAKWRDTIDKQTESRRTGKRHYAHKRLRSCVNSIDFYLPYLFTYQKPGNVGMPNTNSKIEGVFTALKNSTRVHSGMPDENCKRFISGFFLAWNGIKQV